MGDLTIVHPAARRTYYLSRLTGLWLGWVIQHVVLVVAPSAPRVPSCFRNKCHKDYVFACECGEDSDLDPGRAQPRAERRRAGRSPTVDSDEITKNPPEPTALGPRLGPLLARWVLLRVVDWDVGYRVHVLEF